MTFIKAESGEYHRVWIEREDGDTLSVTLHVRHDLPHLVVESVMDIEWGLWGVLVASGEYPGLTEGHMAAKAITNGTVAVWRYGAATVEDVRACLRASKKPENAARRSYDHEVALRIERLVDERLATLGDDAVEEAAKRLEEVLAQWNTTPPGEPMRLRWPLHDDEPSG